MSNPAHRPPDDSTTLELLKAAVTELLLLALAFLVGFAVAVCLIWTGALPEEASWSGLLVGSVSIGSAALAYMGFEQYARGTNEVRPLVREGDRKSIGTCLLIVVAGFVASLTGAGLLGALQEQLFSIEVSEQDAILQLVENGNNFDLVLLTVSAVILAPMCEELLFRHMFFRRLIQQVGPFAAWTLPALAFALAHWNPVGLLVYVWLGTVFAMAYALSGRLWVAVLAHAGHNAFALTMLLYAPDILP
jgi:membrane protease YdiL (CAAX protease family)